MIRNVNCATCAPVGQNNIRYGRRNKGDTFMPCNTVAESSKLANSSQIRQGLFVSNWLAVSYNHI